MRLEDLINKMFGQEEVRIIAFEDHELKTLYKGRIDAIPTNLITSYDVSYISYNNFDECNTISVEKHIISKCIGRWQ